MAEGGAAHFCSESRAHDSKCKYFADGGDVVANLETNENQTDPTEEAVNFLAHHGIFGLLNNKYASDAEKYNSAVNKGKKKIDFHTDSLFKNEKIPLPDMSRHKEVLKKWMDKGGIDHDIQKALVESNSPESPQQGILAPTELSQTHPAQNTVLTEAKGNISNYLNSQRPQPAATKLAYDDEADDADAKRNYETALNIALHPMGITNEMQRGTIEPFHVKHFNSMYPQLSDHLQKKFTEKIVKSQLDGEKPAYHVRQGLSLFMNAPLSSELTQPLMAKIQSNFANKQGAPQSAPPAKGRNKKNTSTLTKADQAYLTTNQSIAAKSQSS